MAIPHDENTVREHIRQLENHEGRLVRGEERMTNIERLLEKYDKRMDGIDVSVGGAIGKIGVVEEAVSGVRKLQWWIMGGITTIAGGIVVGLVIFLLTGK